jgi:hypothetical protein
MPVLCELVASLRASSFAVQGSSQKSFRRHCLRKRFAPMKTSLIALLTAFAVSFSLFTLAAATNSEPDAIRDRVPFPGNYPTAFTEIRVANQTSRTLLGTIYANPTAAAVRELTNLPYPDGSVVVMEWAQPVKDAQGELLLDANGLWKKGAVVRVDVMQRGRGYGASYGDQRAGEWVFASYRPDGSPLPPPPNGGWASCAACHAKAAERDFVFRGRFPAIDGK